MKPRAKLLVVPLALATALLVMAAPSAQGQADTVTRGERVRVSRVLQPRPADWIAGTWQSLTAGELVLLTGEQDVVHVPRDSIARLQLSVGYRSHWGRGALVGLLAGVATGVIFEAAACASSPRGWGEGSCIANGYLLIPGLTGGIGTVLGATIGLGVRYERWRELPEPSLLR